MNLVGRLLWVLLRALRLGKGSLVPMQEARLRFHVMPHDLDVNIHVNNARYLQWMDLGRLDYMIRVGLIGEIVRQKWMPVLGGVNIRYHRPLHLLQGVDLVTRLMAWDEKWFYMEQRFEREGKPIATAYAKALFRGPGISIPSAQILDLISPGLKSPPFPPELDGLRDS